MRGLSRETQPLLEGFRVLARMLPRVDGARTVALSLAAVAVAFAQVAIGVVTGVLIGRVVQNRSVTGWTLGLILALPALLLLLQVGQLAGTSVGQTLKRKVDGDLRARVLDLSLSPAGVAHLEDPQLRTLYGAARNLSPFSFTPGDAAVQLTAGLAVRLQPVLAAAVLAWFEPWLAAGSLLVWAFAQLLFIVITIRLVLGAATSMAAPDLVYLRDLVQEPAAAKEVRVFGLAHWFTDRYRTRTTERIALSLEKRRGNSRSYLRAGSVLGVGLAGGLTWIGLQHADGVLSTGATAICVFALLNIFFVPNLLPDVPIMFGVFRGRCSGAGRERRAARADRRRPGPCSGRLPKPAPGERGVHLPRLRRACALGPRPRDSGGAAARDRRAQRRRQDDPGKAPVPAL